MPTRVTELRSRIRVYVSETCAPLDYNHDYDHHIQFVARDAERIAHEEGADRKICWTAAILHELGLLGGREGHDERGPTMAEAFLVELAADTDTDPSDISCVTEVLRVHHDHEAVRNASLEAQCVHDANELHTVGPNGFLRVFSDMIHVLDSKTRHEAMAKLPEYLERQRELLCTTTARRMAEKDTRLLREFFLRYREYEERQ